MNNSIVYLADILCNFIIKQYTYKSTSYISSNLYACLFYNIKNFLVNRKSHS